MSHKLPKMFPSPFSTDQPNIPFAYAELRRKLRTVFVRNVAVVDLPNLGFRQESVSARFSFWLRRVAALFVSILVVVFRAAQKEMVRIYATRIIPPGTVMQNPKAVPDWPVVNCVGNSMRQFAHSFAGRGQAKLAIAVACLADPKPARCGVLNVTRKSLTKRQRRASAIHIALPIAISALSGYYRWQQRRAAEFTVGCYRTASHDLKLPSRWFSLWSGSFGVSAPFGPFFCAAV